MSPRLLVLNAGSSSLKFAVFESDARLASGNLSRIGTEPRLALRLGSAPPETRPVAAADLPAAAAHVLDTLAAERLLEGVVAVGHRIVHGGAQFSAPARLDDRVLARLETLVPLAPLHQPHNLAIVRFTMARLPGAAQVGCFDTAFHAARPRLDKLYALPRALSDAGIIAYGFHGLSYAHIAGRLRDLHGPEAGGRAIVAHLGSGASLCAMKNGASVATTMGFSALDGLVMGSRCGAIDPGVLLHLLDSGGMDSAALSDLLYNRSGLLGVSGLSADMQTLLASDSPAAAEAIDLFIASITRHIGALAATLGGLDTLVFTAGVGENAPEIRQRVGQGAAWLGAVIDEVANAAGALDIAAPASRLAVLVIPTDEELAIADGVNAVLGASPAS